MIPQTYPSTLSANNHMQMVVFVLTDVTGLTRWVDYIPVKPPTTLNTNFANTFETQGYLLTSSLSSISGKQAWLDYIPVYIDYAATIPYSTNASGYIPMDVFAISNLFAAGEQGVWYDPSDFSTMFQDAAGTTPVTAVGQPVGRILDKSGRGNHATQATAASRPVLQQDGTGRYFLLFDGVDDGMQTGNINFTTTDKMTVWSGVRKLSDAANGEFLALGAWEVGATGRFTHLFPGASGVNKFAFGAHNGAFLAVTTSTTHNAPVTRVVTTEALDRNKLRLNGVAISESALVSGFFVNEPLYIGRRSNGTSPFNGRLYSLIVRGAQSTATEISNAETYVNSKTGAY